MNFKSSLNEAGAGHVTSVDFWGNEASKQIVRFNGRNMTLKEFLLKSKKNEEIQRVIEEIEKHKDYRGSVGDFILNLLKDDDGIIDIMIRKSGTYFDEKEIKNNL